MSRQFYLQQVYPQLALPFSTRYPLVRLEDHPAFQPLAGHRLTMLVALTGTGKSTALDALSKMIDPASLTVIPTRREVADCIAIPAAQTFLGEPFRPVCDRVQRFHYTKVFADHVAGGMATAFSWLQLTDSYPGLLISEGIRGANEIRHALRHFPRWTIIELSLQPLTRLRRLSARQERFDQAQGAADVSFLPRELQDDARTRLAAGDITPIALNIMAAEAANYGLNPYADGARYSNYHCLPVDEHRPEQVAKLVRDIIAETSHVNH